MAMTICYIMTYYCFSNDIVAIANNNDINRRNTLITASIAASVFGYGCLCEFDNGSERICIKLQ